MRCPKCGKIIADGSAYCGLCGNRIPASGSGKSSGKRSSQKSSGRSSGGRSRTGRVNPLAIIIPVIAAVAVVAVVFLFKSGMLSEFSGLFGSAYTGDYEGFAEVADRHVDTDEDTGTEYVNNNLLVFVAANTDDETKTEIVETADGTTVGEIEGTTMDVLQIKVKSGSLEELEELADELTALDSVYLATCDFVVGTSASYEAMIAALFPDSDWWSEAVDALTEWGEYTVDMLAELFGADLDETDEEAADDSEEEGYFLSEIIASVAEEGML